MSARQLQSLVPIRGRGCRDGCFVWVLSDAEVVEANAALGGLLVR